MVEPKPGIQAIKPSKERLAASEGSKGLSEGIINDEAIKALTNTRRFEQFDQVFFHLAGIHFFRKAHH
jgi:hypothetical protein